MTCPAWIRWLRCEGLTLFGPYRKPCCLPLMYSVVVNELPHEAILHPKSGSGLPNTKPPVVGDVAIGRDGIE